MTLAIKMKVLLLLIVIIAHMGIGQDLRSMYYYICDSDADPDCVQDNYDGKTGYDYGVFSAFTQVYYDGSNRVRRGSMDEVREEGSCRDYADIAISCYCNSNLCNNHLCQQCQFPNSTVAPTTPQPHTSNQPPTSETDLSCYSCVDCGVVDDDTTIASSEEFLTCFTAIELGNPHFVIRGGSRDYYEDGVCFYEDDHSFVCYCSSSRCNSDAAEADELLAEPKLYLEE
ncbi:unnamed protein product [Meganyctiphanes norvegica]|uniref:Uncharacterized protein n=1 Tax=Meganyctiphanes norvegica TaxID=48144 RepID=A0AAV2RFA3_MEGNR